MNEGDVGEFGRANNQYDSSIRSDRMGESRTLGRPIRRGLYYVDSRTDKSMNYRPIEVKMYE